MSKDSKVMKEYKKLKTGDWAEVVEKPRKIIVRLVCTDDNLVFDADIDGDDNQPYNEEIEKADSIKKVSAPVEISMGGNRAILVFHDGSVRIEGGIEELGKAEALELFRKLGDKLGYDVAA